MSKLSKALSAAGRSSSACPVCARVFDPHTSYAGHHGGRRRYCSVACRTYMRNDRARRKRKHVRQYGALMAMHEAEAAGQLSLVPTPLPPVPEIPPDDD